MNASLAELFPYVLAMLGTGIVGGILAGLLGVGGGIVVVPVLHVVLGLLGIDESVRMHIAVGTSLATIIPVSITSSRSHHKKGAIDGVLVRAWAPWIVVGSIVGTLVAAYVRSQVLSGVFAIVALAVALWMAFRRSETPVIPGLPQGVGKAVTAGGIGLFSTLMGIGGGTLSVPVLSACGYPIRRAVGTASLFGLFIAVPGTIGFIVGGWHHANLPPFSLGYVNLLGFILIVPTSILAAPWGARLAHSIEPRTLKLCFAGFLALTALKFGWSLV
jgi:uncharacterized membrane protein YfcA